MKRYLGIDIGGTLIKYGIYDENGIEAQNESNSINTIRDNVDVVIDSLEKIIKNTKDIEGVGISIPGGVDTEKGIIIEGGAIPGLAGLDLKKILNERTGYNVEIENDANCVVLAEKWIGNGKDSSCFVCITIGTGIGGGILINNKIHTGNTFLAGEFGFIITEDIEDYNNIKTLSSEGATESLIKAVALYKNIGADELNGIQIFNMLKENDEQVTAIYKNWLRKLCIGINNVGFTIDPEKILIGGGVSASTKLLKDIKEELLRINPLTENWEIQSCKFFNSSGKIGAIYNYLKRNGKI